MFRSFFLRCYGFWHWGEGFQTVLFTWYMTFHVELTASEIGLYQALVLSPFLFITLVGGVVSDRVGAYASYSLSSCIYALALIGYGVADWFYGFVPELFTIYCIVAGITSAFSNPAIDTFIPSISEENVQLNNLKAATTHNIAKLSGNITGMAIPLLSSFGGFVTNGLIMFLSVYYLYQHEIYSNTTANQDTSNDGSKEKVLDVVRTHYRTCPVNFDILLSSCMLGLLVVPMGYILWPLILREKFHEFGGLIAVASISTWIGSIFSAYLCQHFSHRINKPGQLAMLLWSGGALSSLMILQAPSFPTYCIVMLMLGLFSVGKAIVYGHYLENCPKDSRGLLISIDQIAFWGLATLGSFTLGYIVEWVGLYIATFVYAHVTLFFVAVLFRRGLLSTLRN